MSLGFIFIQILGLIPSVISFTSIHTGDRKKMLTLMVGCCVMWFIHYWALGAYTGMMINVVGLFRAFLSYNNDKKWASSRAWEFLLVALYIINAILTWAGPVSILPSFSMILTTFALWTHDMRKTRLLFLLNSPPLIVYNLLIHSYSCFAIECCAFISFILAVYRFDIKKYDAKAVQEIETEKETEL